MSQFYTLSLTPAAQTDVLDLENSIPREAKTSRYGEASKIVSFQNTKPAWNSLIRAGMPESVLAIGYRTFLISIKILC